MSIAEKPSGWCSEERQDSFGLINWVDAFRYKMIASPLPSSEEDDKLFHL